MKRSNPAAAAIRDKSVFNFGAGPAMLPRPVMERAREEFLDWGGTGMSVMEVSHRSKEFLEMAERSESDLRNLLGIPSNYHVLFLQGGATSQFAMVPLNLVEAGGCADYLDTGSWSAKAIKEARRYCTVNIAGTSTRDGTVSLPDASTWKLNGDAAYLYYTANETIDGLQFHSVPDVGDVPLACDMTSEFLSHPLDVSRFGVIFAGAQKNFGPAGLVVAIVRSDLVGRARANLPSLYDYAIHAEHRSLYNTPATFSWYMAGLTFRWILDQGGLEAMEQNSIRRSDKVYQAIDESAFYSNPVNPAHRSRMNVPFTLADSTLDQVFLNEAAQEGMVALKGHRSVGGMRASLYNGMPDQGVDALVAFMGDFARRYG